MPTKAQLKKVPNLGETENVEDPMVYVRYFSITGWEWFVVEMDQTNGVCYGWVKGFDNELGYFNLNEMEPIMKDGVFVAVERDLYFEPKRLSEIMGKVEV